MRSHRRGCGSTYDEVSFTLFLVVWLVVRPTIIKRLIARFRRAASRVVPMKALLPGSVSRLEGNSFGPAVTTAAPQGMSARGRRQREPFVPIPSRATAACRQRTAALRRFLAFAC